jgi:pimeloyl-ACP methyl ester carboxylesterase
MFIEVAEGVALHVRVLGEGPPVVMIHGLTLGNIATWYFTTAPALARRHRVILYDLRGHGMSARVTSGYDLATMSRDLNVIVDRLTEGSSSTVTLVGHSYGAVIAMNVAMRSPERVHKLVVVEGPLPPSSLTDVDALAGKREEEVVSAISPDSIPEILQNTTLAEGRRRRRFGDGLRFLARKTSLFSDLRSTKDFSDAELARITCPLLAVYGSRSICRSAGRRLAEKCPEARLLELEGGHMLPLEVPRELTSAIVRFIDG